MRGDLCRRLPGKGLRESSAIVSASVKDDHTSATRPAASPPRSCQPSGSATMPPPTIAKDIAKVICKKLIRSEDGCGGCRGREDMVTALLRMSGAFERRQVSSLR